MARPALGFLAVLLPSAAFAHTGMGQAAGFLPGHCLGGIDQVLAMVAVGVLAFALGGRALWLVLAAFVGVMVVGFVMGGTHVAVPMMELGIARSSVAIGGAAGFVGATAPLHAAGNALAFATATLPGQHGRATARLAGGAFAVAGIAGWT